MPFYSYQPAIVPTCGVIVPTFILEFCFINIAALATKVLNAFVRVVIWVYSDAVSVKISV